jgi:hypothetical protein
VDRLERLRGGERAAQVDALRGDLIVWSCDDPAYVPYRYGAAPRLIDAIFVAGERQVAALAPLAS